MSEIKTQKINGVERRFDNHGTEYDQFNRPMLRRSPEVEAILAKQREQQRAKSHPVHPLKHDPNDKRWQIQSRKDRIDTLNARIHDNAQLKAYYVSVKDPDIMAAWLQECEDRMDEAVADRNRILDNLVVADHKIDQIDGTISSANEEIEKLVSELREIEAETKTPSVRSPSETKQSQARYLLGRLDPKMLQSLLDSGLSEQQILASFGG